eukprot:TRINITY_DN24171_c0_g1_i1.p1 TRINITY_DN24171_c0_g1~~TRINITY_DN24171_c0_g1_i1.p1  ORF type:complete len:368 (+),score=70.06 TRINITY_DN24171_c0_g1_i1:295-1398(+)
MGEAIPLGAFVQATSTYGPRLLPHLKRTYGADTEVTLVEGMTDYIFIKKIPSIQHLTDYVQSGFMVKFVMKIIWFDHVSDKIEDAYSYVARYADNVYRINGYPRVQEPIYGDGIVDSVALSPKDYSHVFHLAAHPAGQYYYGITDKTQHFIHSLGADKDDGACRAKWKLQEIGELVGLPTDLHADGSRPKAVDIGAAPGGWTQYMVSLGLDVCAIDPGDVTIPMPGPGRMVHIKGKAEDFVEQIKEQGPFDALVCDMNLPPFHAIDIAIPLLNMCRPGSLVIITLKAFRKKGKESFIGHHGEKYMQRILLKLKGVLEPEPLVTQLLGNTNNERTILGRSLRQGEASAPKKPPKKPRLGDGPIEAGEA